MKREKSATWRSARKRCWKWEKPFNLFEEDCTCAQWWEKLFLKWTHCWYIQLRNLVSNSFWTILFRLARQTDKNFFVCSTDLVFNLHQAWMQSTFLSNASLVSFNHINSILARYAPSSNIVKFSSLIDFKRKKSRTFLFIWVSELSVTNKLSISFWVLVTA